MAEIAIGKDLPNLKITLGNNTQTDNAHSDEEGEIVDVEMTTDDCPISSKEVNKDEVKVHRKFNSPLDYFRTYENKGGAFITGLDLTSEVLTKKLEERAARFGLEDHPKKPITKDDVNALYKSLEIDTGDTKLSSSKTKNIRLDAVHMRGVEEMSTSEVIHYFQEYGPAYVEWINDFSCNVVWLDEAGAARALLGLSKVIIIQKKKSPSKLKADENEKKDEPEKDTDKDATENGKDVTMEEVIYMSDLSSDDEDDDDKLVAFKHQKSGNPDLQHMDTDMEKADAADTSDGVAVDESAVDVPIPPGHWRLGVPHEKAKAILLRFASNDDKKLPGAEKRSQYYQKYGNPNYGGLRGLISTTRKRKFLASKQRQVVQQLSGKTSGQESSNKSVVVNKYDRKRSRKPRMRMHADDEEERIIKRAVTYSQHRVTDDYRPRSVHDRLGNFDTVYTRKRRHGSDNYDSNENEPTYPKQRKRKVAYKSTKSSEDDDDEEEDSYEKVNSLKSTISFPSKRDPKFSRFNVWTTLAKTMAKESEEFERGRRDKYSRGRDSSPEDLRDRITSNAHKERRNKSRQHSDLRSKLEKMRKDVKLQKHRSPLIVEIQKESDSDS